MYFAFEDGLWIANLLKICHFHSNRQILYVHLPLRSPCWSFSHPRSQNCNKLQPNGAVLSLSSTLGRYQVNAIPRMLTRRCSAAVFLSGTAGISWKSSPLRALVPAPRLVNSYSAQHLGRGSCSADPSPFVTFSRRSRPRSVLTKREFVSSDD